MLFVAVVRARRNPIGRGWLPELSGQAGSYLIICCQSAVASNGKNGLGMFAQLEHHFPGVRIPADVTGCLASADDR
jgi:hypothetical protein